MEYEIHLQGELDAAWSDWFEGMGVQVAKHESHPTMTTLSGPVPDQSALRGILNQLWDLNMTLVSVRRCSEDRGGV